MSSAIAITEENFQQEVLESNQPVLVDFTAAWCGPCQRLAPVIEKLAENYAGKVKVGKVDADSNQNLLMQFGVSSVPTILIFKGGKPVDTVMGYNPERVYASKLDSLVGEGG